VPQRPGCQRDADRQRRLNDDEPDEVGGQWRRLGAVDRFAKRIPVEKSGDDKEAGPPNRRNLALNREQGAGEQDRGGDDQFGAITLSAWVALEIRQLERWDALAERAAHRSGFRATWVPKPN